MNEREARNNVLPFRPHVSNVVPISRRLRIDEPQVFACTSDDIFPPTPEGADIEKGNLDGGRSDERPGFGGEAA